VLCLYSQRFECYGGKVGLIEGDNHACIGANGYGEYVA
jgi:hypothetical protein